MHGERVREAGKIGRLVFWVGTAIAIRECQHYGAADMSGSNGTLRSVLVDRYDYLLERLAKRLRSSERAQDALHDTYVRLSKSEEVSATNPVGFLMRVAINIAYDRFRAERRRVSDVEIDAALDIADDTPDPLQTASAKSDFALLEKAIAQLPARRRALFLISLKERVPSAELARQFGLSRRRVDAELQLAREYCATFLLDSGGKRDQIRGAKTSPLEDDES